MNEMTDPYLKGLVQWFASDWGSRATGGLHSSRSSFRKQDPSGHSDCWHAKGDRIGLRSADPKTPTLVRPFPR